MNNFEEHNPYPESPVKPSTAFGASLLVIGVAVACIVLSETWKFYQSGSNNFVVLMVKKLTFEGVLFTFENKPIILTDGGKYLISLLICFILGSFAITIATNFIKAGISILYPEVKPFQKKLRSLENRIQSVENRQI